jgi:glycosyltransferase involved in cell wall biosynthesis
VARDELQYARAIASGLERTNPSWRLTVLVFGSDDATVAGEPFETVGIDALGAPGQALLEVVTAGPRALGAALRPALMAWLAERQGGIVVWLDPTVKVLGALDPLVEAARDGVALVPLHTHTDGPAVPTARGPFESGVVAASDPVPLRWWADSVVDRARRQGSAFDPLGGDLLAALVGATEPLRIVRDRSLCAGWWTLAAGAALTAAPLAVDGEPLRAFNFAGFDPARPHWLSTEDESGLVRVSGAPALADLTAGYAAELEALRPSGRPAAWPYAKLANGIALDADLRDLFAAAQRDGAELPSPFEERGCERFLDWIDGELPAVDGMTRYLDRVYRRRADLQVAFPDLAGGDARGLVEWMHTNGADEEPLLRILLDRRGRRAPASTRRGASKARVRFVGYFNDGLGLGQAARSYAGALAAAGVATETVSIPVPVRRSTGDHQRLWRRKQVEWEAGPPAGPVPPIEIVCMNPPELLRAHASGALAPDPAYRVGAWAWELGSLPEEWKPAFDLVDEIWVYTEHVAGAFGQQGAVPVEIMPLAVEAPAEPERRQGGKFTFLFMFDLLSSQQRKNPLGLIAAFRAAFDPGEGPRLVIKTSNGDNEPEQLERVRIAAVGRPDIEVVDEFVSPQERDALIAGCDCYVSLHRAEGFGLTLAEAMAAGRPVIATGFSGNLDFMTPATSYLVGWRPARVEAGSAVYPEGAAWAEPDLDEAAALMRRVYSDRNEAEVRGRLGREHVARTLSPDAVGRRLRERVERIEKDIGGTRGGGLRAVLGRRRPG